MFTVVIPLYNKEKSIKATIQSVLRQSCPEFEVVVVNDGSTDNSFQVVETIKDRRLRIINQPNQGVSAARNRGIREANYDWVAFLDADDLWEEEHLLEYKSGISSFPETKWLFSGFIIDNGKKRTLKVFNIDGKLSNVFDSLLSGAVIHTSTVCVKRSLFEMYNNLYFSVGLSSSEDREVWYKLACIDKSPVYIAKALSIYNIGNDGSLTTQNAISLPDDFLDIKERIEGFSKLIPKQDQCKLFEFLSRFNRKVLLERYKSGFLKNEYEYYFGSFEFNVLRRTVMLPRVFRSLVSRSLSRV